jgi:hypothetical protein
LLKSEAYPCAGHKNAAAASAAALRASAFGRIGIGLPRDAVTLTEDG